MSDDFDITLERKLESSADKAANGHSQVRRIELITGTGRRRRWSGEAKARILVESFAPGANVSEVARRNGVSPQQLFAWRREARALFAEEGGAAAGTEARPGHRGTARGEPSSARRVGGKSEALLRNDAAARQQRECADETPPFVPVVMTAATAPSSPPPPVPSPSGLARIEIVIADTIVRVVGEVEAAALVSVLVAVRRAS
jgi:transposase-like protein